MIENWDPAAPFNNATPIDKLGADHANFPPFLLTLAAIDIEEC